MQYLTLSEAEPLAFHLPILFSSSRSDLEQNREGMKLDMLDQQVDDKGTDQTEAKEIIRRLCDGAFEGDADKLAVALGRSTEHVQAVLSGAEPADDDLVMKARGIAINRGVEVE